MNRKRFPTSGIYRCELSSSHFLTEDDERRYRYITPIIGTPPTSFVADCWIVDANGCVNPGTAASPVPVRRDDIGRRIK
jgi:hypothetical protein